MFDIFQYGELKLVVNVGISDDINVMNYKYLYFMLCKYIYVNIFNL